MSGLRAERPACGDGGMNTTPTVADWGGTSRFVDLGGPVHYADFGGPADGRRIVFVHGLGGSHLNWCLIAGLLAPHARLIAVDLPGFGLTNPVGRSTTVAANAALLHRFLTEVVGEPAVLVGNSMGGMIAIRHAAAYPDTVTALVLLDPALPVALGVLPDPIVTRMFALYAVPTLGAWLMARERARITAYEQVMRVYRLCCVDPNRVPPQLIEATAALAERRRQVPGLDAAFLAAARSILRVTANRAAYWATMRAIQAPVLLLHGESDRLVPVASARAAAARNPSWAFTTFPGIGHVPQVEAPDLTAARILDWLAYLPLTTADRG
jgi:pimeloyl-ACP methyl ester carboxylesterase